MTAEIVSVKAIARLIYLVRGQRVLLDRELAALYRVETRVLNQAVKRNTNRFPEDFMFRLSRQQIARISQSVTSVSGLKFSKRVHAFTEEGVATLSSVVNGERTVQEPITDHESPSLGPRRLFFLAELNFCYFPRSNP